MVVMCDVNFLTLRWEASFLIVLGCQSFPGFLTWLPRCREGLASDLVCGACPLHVPLSSFLTNRVWKCCTALQSGSTCYTTPAWTVLANEVPYRARETTKSNTPPSPPCLLYLVGASKKVVFGAFFSLDFTRKRALLIYSWVIEQSPVPLWNLSSQLNIWCTEWH